MIDITGLREDKRPQSSTIVHALLDRLEAAENDAAHQKALAESALRVAEGWERKCGELRAKIAEMERQEPIGTAMLCAQCSTPFDGDYYCPTCGHHTATEETVYALPGAQAQPAPSIPDGWLQHSARMATLARKLREPDWCFESIREMQRELRTLEEAALAAARGEPEQPAPSVPNQINTTHGMRGIET